LLSLQLTTHTNFRDFFAWGTQATPLEKHSCF
jgi:hypothetical protein